MGLPPKLAEDNKQKITGMLLVKENTFSWVPFNLS